MTQLAKTAEVRSQQSDRRALSKVYVDGEPFPWYLAVGSGSVKPSSDVAGMYELTVTLLIDGPVTLNSVKRSEVL